MAPVELETNIGDLPISLFQQLAASLATGDVWLKIVDDDKKSKFYSSQEEIDRLQRHSAPTEQLLRLWGARGMTTHSLLYRLQVLHALQMSAWVISNAKGGGHGSTAPPSAPFDRPQLALRRQFVSVRWAMPETPINVAPTEDNSQLVLYAGAVGFPAPSYQWMRSGEPIQGETSPLLRITKCRCEIGNEYSVAVSNQIEAGQSYSDFYRSSDQNFVSSLTSNVVDVEAHVKDDHACDRCKENELEKIREIMNGVNVADIDNRETIAAAIQTSSEDLIAADKVALIISNCTYRHLPQLHTPHCDAESLAQALQEMHFKTVTLADLTLPEMRFVIQEYRRLLGNDVYAVLYFAGHGFEVNGQCYLLPVEAPLEAHAPEHCISMDWVLAVLSDYSPALNLILLDVCRKYIPMECITPFIAQAEAYKNRHRPNRNTVYGYSTSGGVGAYEVKGEVNGVFMKYLKRHLTAKASVLDMLNAVLKDIEADDRVRDVQIPELRLTLTKPRSLTDQLIFDGHTISFDHHTIHWRLMHELPTPVDVYFPEQQVAVTVWFSYIGHFTNKVYMFTSVYDLDGVPGECEDMPRQERALAFLAYLRFPPELETTCVRVEHNEEEGVSLGMLLSHLQRSKGEIRCTVELAERRGDEAESDEIRKVVAMQEATIGHVLITRLEMFKTTG